MMHTENVMAPVEPPESRTKEIVISPRDIVFECPSCRKSLVVDDVAEGLIIDCPQCHINVIVPPKPIPTAPPPARSEPVKPVEEQKPQPPGDDVRARLATVAGKLKELQTQRTEINSRLASRINEINRDLVMMARLETGHQQILAELTQIVTQIGTNAPAAAAGPRTRVNLRS